MVSHARVSADEARKPRAAAERQEPTTSRPSLHVGNPRRDHPHAEGRWLQGTGGIFKQNQPGWYTFRR